MPMTLTEMRVGMEDKLQQQLVDNLIRRSEILELMPFDNCISPGAGSTLTYGYIQKKLPSTTGFRALNSEYSPTLATVEKKTVQLKIFGGAFDMDRVLKAAEGKYDNMAFQVDEKVISGVGTFHDSMINGDSQGEDATTDSPFDGLDKMLLGQSTEYGTGKAIDLSTIAALKANADEAYEALTKLIRATSAQALLLNGDMIAKIQTLARVLGYKTETEEAFGRKVSSIDGVRLIDLGDVYEVDQGAATAREVIGKKTRTLDSGSTTGLTDVYGVKFDVYDGFHGITLTGSSGFNIYLPDWASPSAVKKGEVEMVGAVALKNTLHGGVYRNFKIA